MIEVEPFDARQTMPEVLETAGKISAMHLNGRDARFVGAVLAELMGRLLVNFDEATAARLIDVHAKGIAEITAVNRRVLPPDWRARHG